MEPYRIVKQGYMLKEPPASQRGMRKKLRRYWFVLIEDPKKVAFVYYKNEETYIARQRNVGYIRIDNSEINVVGDYLTYKNAFSIVTEKSKYMFVSETRYELHDWIFVLHNTLEGFHCRTERVKVRLEQRQRVYSASSAASDSVQNSGSPTVPTPFHQAEAGATPTKKAPPSPQTTPTQTPPVGSPRSRSHHHRRPRRPAPVAPGRPRGTDHTHNHTHPTPPPYQYCHEEAVFVSMSQTPSSPYGTMEQHQVLHLNINTQTEEVQREEGEGEAAGEGEREWGREGEEERERVGGWGAAAPGEGEMARGGEWEREGVWEVEKDLPNKAVIQLSVQQPISSKPSPQHQRSVSDTSVLLTRSRINSSSLPELADDHTSSTSPEPVADTVEAARQQMSRVSPKKQFRTKHTRHLSLLNGREGKQKKRRSAHYRSRSPPNYPPPPPPANEDSANEEETPTAPRKDSLGFSKVMQTISSIDQELQEMGGVAGTETTPNISPPMSFKAIDPPTSEGEGVVGVVGVVGAVGEDGGYYESGSNVSPAPLLQAEETEPGDPPEEAATIIPFSPTASSPTKKTPPPIPAKPKLKPKPKKNKVMFKEEVEDIPSYEPRIDNEEATPTLDEEGEGGNIPSSVAALKKMLFGQKVQTQKYSKEGPMSLRFGAIVDTEDYDEGLHDLLSPTQCPPSLSPLETAPPDDSAHYQHLSGFTATEPDHRETGQSPTVPGQQSGSPDIDQPQENEYDSPWDSKPISRFSVVGHRKQTAVSPAQRRAESFEVMTHTTALPSNTEWRNVHSLERQLKSSSTPSQTSPRQQYSGDAGGSQVDGGGLKFTDPLDAGDSDLLQSISSTLQTRSKYGSESLLTSFSQGDIPANYYQQQAQAELKQREGGGGGGGGGGGHSTRAELDRIRTQHKKKSITLPTTYTSHGDSSSKLQQRRGLSMSYQSVNRGSAGGGGGGGGRGGGGGEGRRKRVPLALHKGARKAQSVDALQVDPTTLVTYNTYTKSHTLQSLV